MFIMAASFESRGWDCIEQFLFPKHMFNSFYIWSPFISLYIFMINFLHLHRNGTLEMVIELMPHKTWVYMSAQISKGR